MPQPWRWAAARQLGPVESVASHGAAARAVLWLGLGAGRQLLGGPPAAWADGATAWPASAVRPDGITSGSFTRAGSCTRTGSFVVGQCLGAQLVVGAGRRPGDAEIREVGFFPTKYFESLLPGQSRKRPTRRGCPRGRPSLEPARGPPGPRRQKNASWNGGRGGRFRRIASASLAPCTSSASTARLRATRI